MFPNVNTPCKYGDVTTMCNEIGGVGMRTRQRLRNTTGLSKYLNLPLLYV